MKRSGHQIKETLKPDQKKTKKEKKVSSYGSDQNQRLNSEPLVRRKLRLAGKKQKSPSPSTKPCDSTDRPIVTPRGEATEKLTWNAARPISKREEIFSGEGEGELRARSANRLARAVSRRGDFDVKKVVVSGRQRRSERKIKGGNAFRSFADSRGGRVWEAPVRDGGGRLVAAGIV